ncbi:MAG TPA: alkaline phosphatase family protein [Catenuloplanes sp.]
MAVRTVGTASGPVRPGRSRRLWASLRDWRFTVDRVRSLVRSMLTSFLVLSATLWLLPGVNASGLVSILWLVVLVSAVGALLRPLLLALATILGGLGALSLGVCVQSIIMYVALVLDPQVDVANFGAAFVASWIAVALAALVNWLADAGTDDAFISETVRLMGRIHRRDVRSGEGLLVVQLDGVSAPLLRWAVRAGNLPNIGRLLHTGSHRLAGWHTGVPATTPAVQAGILHGDVRQVPAFRWYEKETGRLVVTNRPRDAAEVERRLSDGRGLLRDGGASISNIFSGDAPLSLLTVSRAALPGRSARGYASFMMYGFPRALVLGVGEILKELHQGRVQRRRDVQPRVRRGGAYLALRPATNVLLRDLNVSLIAEQMALGAPVIFCDFVDYDEVAHHAGPARPESLSALEGLDRVVGILQRLSAEAARQYHVVVLSDHGQSQGATFRQRYGEPVEHLVQRLVQDGASAAEQRCASATHPVEQWGPLNALLTDIAGRPGPAGAATRAAVRSHTHGAEVALGPAAGESRAVDAATAEAVVVASGNLAMVYLTRLPGRAGRAGLERAYPGLVEGLAAHPGIGIVVVDDDGGPVAVGAHGSVRLTDGTVTGIDPLLAYGPRARADLLRHQRMEHVGDLVLISLVDPATDEVAAFEELVGCHGGLGGWQTDAVLVHPATWPSDADELVGADAVHRQLLRWLRQLGLRADDPDGAPTAGSPADHPAGVPVAGRDAATVGAGPSPPVAPPVGLTVPVGGPTTPHPG